MSAPTLTMKSPASDTVNPGIFDLPESLVKSMLEAARGETITDYSVRLYQRTSVEGICGEYLLAYFTARTDGGTTVEASMFVRRQLRPSDRKRQAHHYEYLSARGVPLPHLYGSHLDGQGREILFLELLDEVGAPDAELMVRQDYLEEYLRLAAILAAVPLTDDYVGRLGYDLAGRDYVLNWGEWLPWSAHILGRIQARAATGELGPSLRDYCSENSTAIARLRGLCLPLMHAVRALPLGLVHGDLRPGNTGRRKADGQLVLYDLEDLSIDARFYDVGQVLGGPRPVLPGRESNDQLAVFFLRVYAECSGRSVHLQDFLREARIVWAARTINLWEHLPPSVGGPPYDHRAFVRDERERSEKLSSTLAQLVESLSSLCVATGCAA